MKRDDLLDLNDALQHPGRKVAVDLSTELPNEEEIDLVAPVEGFLEAVSTGNVLLVHGEFKTRCVVECARCAGPLEVDMDFTMDEEFPVEGTPSTFGGDETAKVVPEFEPNPLFEDNNLLVENLLRQGVILNLPIQALCSFGWEGDCPQAKAVDERRQGAPIGGPFDHLVKLIQPEEPER